MSLCPDSNFATNIFCNENVCSHPAFSLTAALVKWKAFHAFIVPSLSARENHGQITIKQITTALNWTGAAFIMQLNFLIKSME